MARKKDFNYYKFFIEMIHCACNASAGLRDMLTNYDVAALAENREKIHQFEHEADLKKHEMTSALIKEFLPPIDREDIVRLAHVLDDVVDCIDDVTLHLYIFDIQSIRPEALKFADLICRCCDSLVTLLTDFENFKKSTSFHDRIVEVHGIEEEGDALYVEAVRALYTTCANAIEISAWKELFDCLERCCDVCENVADAVEEVVLKNS